MSLATIVEASLLFIVLQRRLAGFETGHLASFLLRTVAATALMAAAVSVFIAVEKSVDPLGAHTVWEALVQVVGSGALGGGTFFLVALLLRCEEARALWRRLGLVRSRWDSS
jgi:peptidoglycan biosynthesis protein MviN/MurJ (putative lipid II flippase)